MKLILHTMVESYKVLVTHGSFEGFSVRKTEKKLRLIFFELFGDIQRFKRFIDILTFQRFLRFQELPQVHSGYDPERAQNKV